MQYSLTEVSSLLIDGIGYFGTIVFAVSGAMAASRLRMDPIGFMLLGTVTAIGGGTLRDLLLDVRVEWITDPSILTVCLVATLGTYFLPVTRNVSRDVKIWSDALGLSAFAISGAQKALSLGASPVVSILLGVLSATGGGIIRDMLSGHSPHIVRGELYVSTAAAGATAYTLLAIYGFDQSLAVIIGFFVVLSTRAASLLWDIRMGPPGEFIKVLRRRPSLVPPPDDEDEHPQ